MTLGIIGSSGPSMTFNVLIMTFLVYSPKVVIKFRTVYIYIYACMYIYGISHVFFVVYSLF